jgi:hypothetical protein
MTDLAALRVSLTKHGAHKISRLLRRFPPEEVLASTVGVVDDVNIDRTQAAVIMSASANGSLPEYWTQAKALGGDVIDVVTLISIVFSHVDLIGALQKSSDSFAHGVVVRPTIDGKAFTNFKNDLIELGFAGQNDRDRVEYDFSRIFRDPRVPPLVSEIFSQKLRQAGWNGRGDLVEECLNCGFHAALAIPEAPFRVWMSGTGDFEAEFVEVLDELAELDEKISDFGFRHGHAAKKETSSAKRSYSKARQALELAHNRLQTKLHAHLVELHGDKRVGTEVLSGIGTTAVDIVTQLDGGHTFYELKTSGSLRKCIRDALPQLLEYAYWPDADRAKELVIVSPAKPNDNARKYLEALRKRFSIPIFYQQFDEKTGKLLDRI